jgi:hypothetical protein
MFDVCWNGGAFEEEFPGSNGGLIDYGFLEDDGSGIWKLIEMKVGFIALMCDTSGMGIGEQKVEEEGFACIGGTLKDESVNFC